MRRDPRYLQGIAHFNARHFYDAHETWEDLWHGLNGDEARFVQGLIQYATALHHFRAGNLKGARALVEGGGALLGPLTSPFWGLDVTGLIQAMRACAAELLTRDLKDLPGRYHPEKDKFPVKIDDERIPTLTLAEAA